jgi:hypothetical protein
MLELAAEIDNTGTFPLECLIRPPYAGVWHLQVSWSKTVTVRPGVYYWAANEKALMQTNFNCSV